MVYFRTN